MTHILMVCLGNICRSPLAEGIMRKKIEEAGISTEVDSAGTANYHVGEQPDRRSIKKGKEYNIDIAQLSGRQFVQADFDNFDYIYVMDHSNYDNVTRLARNEADINKVKLILEEAENVYETEVPDPYYGGEDGFEHVYQLLDNACNNIIKKLQS